MQTCRQCKARQLDGVLFCSECGAALFDSGPRNESTASLGQTAIPDSTPLPAATIVPVPPPVPTRSGSIISLVVINSGRRMTLDGSDDLLVGRKDNTKGIFPDIDLGLDGGYDAG